MKSDNHLAVTVADFVFTPVGHGHHFTNDAEISSILSAPLSVELHCPECNKDRIFVGIRFHMDDLFPGGTNLAASDRVHRIKYTCACDRSWMEMFLEVRPEHQLVKVGQYPDITCFDSNVNGEPIALASNDERRHYLSAAKAYYVGLYVAAFGYLRRVLESLISQAEAAGQIDKPATKMKSRVQELVNKGLLSDLLMEPGFNVLYSLLSKGMHELSESECKSQYPFLRDAIDIILEDKLRAQQFQKRKAKLGRDLNDLHSNNHPNQP